MDRNSIQESVRLAHLISHAEEQLNVQVAVLYDLSLD